MAYTALNIGYTPQAGYEYTATTDSNADWPSVPNNTYFFDFTERQVYYKDMNGGVYGAYVGGATSLNTYNVSATQWSKTLPAPVSLPNGALANGFTFFDDTNKVAGGTTAYDEYDIAFGITITLSGTLGSANINVDGVDYLATFDTNLFTTASNWVATNQATLNALNVRVFSLGSGTDGRIRFCSTEAILNAITITPTIIQVANLNGTLANEFTGGATAVGDHLLIPYAGKPYFGKRILHTIRVNFNIATGSLRNAELGLFRYANDSQIGSSILIQRTPDVSGNFVVLETYTSNALDPFVTGGFYIGLVNNSSATLEFFGSTGILILNIFDSETSF